MTAQLDFMETIQPPTKETSVYHWALGNYRVGRETEYLCYPIGHPWWKIMGGIPTRNPWSEQVEPCPADHFGKVPKDLRGAIEIEKAELAADIERYLELCDYGCAAIRCPSWTDDAMMTLATALGLKVNHIMWHRGRLKFLNQQLVNKRNKSCKQK